MWYRRAYVLETNEYQHVDIKLDGHKYRVKIWEKEIDETFRDAGVNPLHVQLYATRYSRTDVAHHIAAAKLEEALTSEAAVDDVWEIEPPDPRLWGVPIPSPNTKIFEEQCGKSMGKIMDEGVPKPTTRADDSPVLRRL